MAPMDKNVVFIRGWVDCGAHEATADIFVYNAAGDLLNEPPSVQPARVQSGSSGAFLVAARDVPKAFRVVAENVRFSGDLAAALKAEVRNFDPTQDIVHINPVTTLVVNTIERSPGGDYEEAQTRVKRFLNIPDGVNLGDALDVVESHFSMMEFVAEAKAQGGVELLLERLLKEMETVPQATHPFYALRAGVGGAAAVIGLIADKMVGGALSYAGTQALGWVLSEIGIGFPDATAEAIKEMQEDLKQIKNLITGLSVQLDSVYSSLSKEIKQTSYDVRVGQLIPLISTIKSVSQDIAFLAGVTVSDERKTWIVGEQARLKTVIGQQLIPQSDAIHTQQIGIGGAEGLIQVWSKVVASRHRFLGPEDSRMMHAQFDFFDSLQLSLFGLVIEYHHAAMPKDLARDKLKPLVDGYVANRKTQLAMRPLEIPASAVIETRTGLMISPYTIWEDAPDKHFGNHFGCNLPRHNAKPVAVASPYFASPPWNIACDLPKNSKFSSPLMGFSNWRMATKDEAEKMFFGWEGKDVAQWAISQGYPKEYLTPKVVIFLTNQEAFFDRRGSDKSLESWQVSMTNGVPTLIKCTWPGGTGQKPASYYCHMLECTLGPKGHLIPVRRPGDDEIYFY